MALVIWRECALDRRQAGESHGIIAAAVNDDRGDEAATEPVVFETGCRTAVDGADEALAARADDNRMPELCEHTEPT